MKNAARGDSGSAPPAEAAPGVGAGAELALADGFQERVSALKDEVGKIIVGQERVIEQILITLLAGGHCVLEGVPGLAKTLVIHTLASTLSLKYGRIQFTPDLMPADVTGTQVIDHEPGTGVRHFHFQKGPVFANFLLADEINRTPPKTQAALLEAMSERQVTVAGKRHPLPTPFFVLATQNPIEQEGTYTLPEAQLDRFLLKVFVDYPELDEEELIIRRTTTAREETLKPILSRDEILGLQRIVRALHVSTHVMDYATRLVRASRPDDISSDQWVRQNVAWGAGPRAIQALLLAGKARTLLEGRFAVTRGDIRDVALPVLRHRIIPSFHAEGEGRTADDIICRLLLETSPFPDHGSYDGATTRILRR